MYDKLILDGFITYIPGIRIPFRFCRVLAEFQESP